MKLRILSLLALAAMLLPLAGCGQKPDAPTENTAADTAAVTDTAAPEETTTVDPSDRSQVKDNLPADLRFDGETINVLFRGSEPSGMIYELDVGGTNNAGDYVTDSVYERNRSVEDRLGVTFVFTPTNAGNLTSTAAFVKQLVMAGSDEYDYINTTGNTNVIYSLNAYLRDLSEAPYIDYEQPWWWTDAIAQLSLDGKTFNYIIGDIIPYGYRQTAVTFYNKQIYEDIWGDPDEMYKTVMDGKWTIDLMTEMVEAAYSDVNGNGVSDVGDRFGSITGSAYATRFFIGFDIEMYHRDENGSLVIDFDAENATLATEKMYKFFQETTGITSASGQDAGAEIFTNGNMLFYPGVFSYAMNANFREMEQPYGLIPFPKLTEAQPEYHASLENACTNISIMKPVSDARMNVIGAVLEALCAESYRSVMPKFLETAMKLKYSPDQMSGKVIDLVVSGLTKNTLNEYANFTADIFNNCLTQPGFGNGKFACVYAKVKPAAQKTWDKAIASALQG